MKKLTDAQAAILSMAQSGILVPERGGFWRFFNGAGELWSRIEQPNITHTVRALLKHGCLLEVPHLGPGCFTTFEMSRHSKVVELSFKGATALQDGRIQ